MRTRPRSQTRRAAGFTLVELLVALAVMILIAMMSWRGIGAMSDAQHRLQERGDEVQALQMALAQWAADLEALAPAEGHPALAWDGQTLRLLRHGTTAGEAALHVVAWSHRLVGDRGMWLRWQSGPLQRREALQQAWQQAGLWGQNATDVLRRQEVAVVALAGWQLYYHRQDAWTHPLSSEAQDAPGLPQGVRLVLSLPPDAPLTGRITRDWVRPTQGGGAS
jgi:general secretion pathway protein J